MDALTHFENTRLNRVRSWIALQRERGFTLFEATEFSREIEVLASPVVFNHQCLRRYEWMRKLSREHQNLRQQIESIQTPEAWNRWKKGWTNGDIKWSVERSEDAFWGLVALGEETPDLVNRRHGKMHSLIDHSKIKQWKDLENLINSRLVLNKLKLASFASFGIKGSDNLNYSLQKALRLTGLRSIRWNWFEEIKPEAIPYFTKCLIGIQNALIAPLGWMGPVLGLNGETGLVLSAGKRSEGVGQVFLDPNPSLKRHGQQLYLDTLEVLPHEWLHTLDSTLARDTFRQRKWATLSIMEGEDNLPQNLTLKTALEAWWDQVIRVQFAPLPDEVYAELCLELPQWPQRILNALGHDKAVRDMIKHEQKLIQSHQWTAQDSLSEWKVFLNLNRPGVSNERRHRTAALLSGEIGLSLIPNLLPIDEPMWVGFLNSITDPKIPPQKCTDCQAYLVNPLEIMARSFEVAFQTIGSDNLFWGTPHQQAGMIWPLEAERLYQQDGWTLCFEEMEGWWYQKMGCSLFERQKKLKE